MTPKNELPPVLISDIDGTVAFIALDDLGGPVRAFNDFYESDTDIPNSKVVTCIKAWYSTVEGGKIFFITNRPDVYRDVTLRWLTKVFPPVEYNWALRMRPFYSEISLVGLKESHLQDILRRYRVEQVWEDDPDCISMYQEHGLLVFDARETW